MTTTVIIVLTIVIVVGAFVMDHFAIQREKEQQEESQYGTLISHTVQG